MRRACFILFLLALILTACAAPWADSTDSQEMDAPVATEVLQPTLIFTPGPAATPTPSNTPMPIESPTHVPIPTTPPTPTQIPITDSFPAGSDPDRDSRPAASSELCAYTFSPQLPDTCSVEDVTGLVTRFLDAFNNGDVDAAAGFFIDQPSLGNNADRGKFQWYSAGGWDDVEGRTIYDPADLPAYFTERNALRERMDLRGLIVRRSSPSTVGFTLTITRRADDLSERTVIGKGEINCALQKIYVWSLGDG